MIFTQFNKPEAKPTNPGSHFIDTYQEIIDKKGKLRLEKTGQSNVYERIQSNVESCKIENILHAVAMGDLNALHQREATYCDSTTMPKTLRDAQDLVIRLKDEFYKMPLDVRKEFENSPEMYVSLMGTEEFKEIMAPYNEKIAKIAAEKSDKEYRAKVKEGAKLNYDIAKEQAIIAGGENSEQK